MVLNGRLRLSGPLARMTADRFELLLSQRLILRDLGAFIDGRIRRIHGKRVAELLHEILVRRVEMVETALEGLRLQYPGYAEELERRFIRRTDLRLEEREYAAMRKDGLIGAEVYTTLMQDLDARRAVAEERPHLDIALQRAKLVRQFPLFAELDDAVLKRLGHALQMRYVNASEVIIRKDSAATSVFFMGWGRWNWKPPGRPSVSGGARCSVRWRSCSRRPAAPRFAPSTLLVFDEARFRRLLDRSEALQNAVRASAEKRGVDPAQLFEGTSLVRPPEDQTSR